jgi:predicted transcriptional regulator
MQETYPVTVRMPLADVAKLDRIAHKTHRTRANLIKHLVALADETGLQDVRLTPIAGEDHAA